MPKLNVYNLEAKEIREIELAEAVFGIEPNQQVMFDALIMQRANMRQGTHDTKSRHEVDFRSFLHCFMIEAFTNFTAAW